MKRGIHETMPPLTPGDEARIKGRDARSTEEIALGAITDKKASESFDAFRVMNQAKKKVEGLKQEIKGINKLLDEKIDKNQQVIDRFAHLRAELDEVDKELLELGVGPDAEKMKNLSQIIDSIDNYVRDLEKAKWELKDQITSLEETNGLN